MTFFTQSIGTTSNAGKTFSKANVGLWLAQGALALLFLFSGADNLLASTEQMNAKIEIDIPMWFMRCIGVCEVAGALGLILPSVSRIRTGLTALAACGLVVIMIGATVVTAIAGPVPAAAFPLLVGVTAAFIAYGRTYVAPIAR